MSYIESGKVEGATLHVGGSQLGSEGYFIQPTIFTDCKPDMKIVKEEIFGPVGVFIKFKDEAGKCGDGIQSPITLMNNHSGKMSLSRRTILHTVWLRQYFLKTSIGPCGLLMRSRLERHGCVDST
jgi:hypothetical protein